MPKTIPPEAQILELAGQLQTFIDKFPNKHLQTLRHDAKAFIKAVVTGHNVPLELEYPSEWMVGGVSKPVKDLKEWKADIWEQYKGGKGQQNKRDDQDQQSQGAQDGDKEDSQEKDGQEEDGQEEDSQEEDSQEEDGQDDDSQDDDSQDDDSRDDESQGEDGQEENGQEENGQEENGQEEDSQEDGQEEEDESQEENDQEEDDSQEEDGQEEDGAAEERTRKGMAKKEIVEKEKPKTFKTEEDIMDEVMEDQEDSEIKNSDNGEDSNSEEEEAPATGKPTTSKAATSKSTSKSTTGKPTGKPTTSKPTTSKPTTSKPTTSKPTTSKPTTSKPTTSKPTTSKPTTSKSTTSKSTTSKPTTSKSTTSKPTTSKPTTSKSTTSKSTTSKSTTSKPTTSKPTTSKKRAVHTEFSAVRNELKELAQVAASHEEIDFFSNSEVRALVPHWSHALAKADSQDLQAAWEASKASISVVTFLVLFEISVDGDWNEPRFKRLVAIIKNLPATTVNWVHQKKLLSKLQALWGVQTSEAPDISLICENENTEDMENQRQSNVIELDANLITISDPETGATVEGEIRGKCPTRPKWLCVVLPSRNPRFPNVNRYYWIDAGMKHPQALERYMRCGTNITLGTGSNLLLEGTDAIDQFEIIGVLVMPWGKHSHIHALGHSVLIPGRPPLLFARTLLASKYSASDTKKALAERMVKSGQTLPKALQGDWGFVSPRARRL